MLRNLEAEIDGLRGSAVQDIMRRRNVSSEAKIAVSQQLLPGSTRIDQGEHETRAALAVRAFINHGTVDKSLATAPPLRINRRDMVTAGAATGAATGTGVMVPIEYYRKITSQLRSYSNLLTQATLDETATGRPKMYPSDQDALVQGALLPEGVQSNLLDLKGPGSVTLNAWKFESGTIRVSNEWLADFGGNDTSESEPVDADGYVIDRASVRLSRVMSQYFTTGTGINQPTGFLNSSALVNVGVAVGNAAQNGVGGGNTLGVSDLTAILNAVDPMYRPNGRWMCASSVLMNLQNALDKQGHPIWPGLHRSPDGIPRILGFPVEINNSMPALQTQASSPPVSVTPIVFADWSRFHWRMAPLWIYRLDELFADFFQTAFLVYARADFNAVDQGNFAATISTVY